MATVAIHKRKAWQIWKDVIFALFVREIRVGFNDKFGLSWALINPLLFIFVLSFGRSFIAGSDTHTLPTFHFMAIGILYIQSFLNILQATAASINKNKALYAFRQVQPISAVIAAAIFEFLVKFFVLVLLLIVMFIFKMELFLDNGLMFIACFVLLVVLGFSLGLAFGIAELYITEIRKVRELMTRPMFFISGTFFSLQDIPPEYWYLLNWNPVLHAIELSRYATLTTYGDAGVSLSFLFIVVFTILFLSLSYYYAFWKQAISR